MDKEQEHWDAAWLFRSVQPRLAALQSASQKGIKLNVSNMGQESVQCNCSIDTFRRDFYPTCYLLIFVVGLVGNAFSFYYFVAMYRKMRSFTSMTLYLVNLLVSDFMLVCSLPFRASYYLTDTWVFGDAVCRIMSYVFYINMYSSIFFLTALSVMRYLAVTRPYRYVYLQKSRGAWAVCLFIWLFVSLASIPLLKEGSHQVGKDNVKCLELNIKNAKTIITLNYITVGLGFVLPFAVISFCYIFVVYSLVRPREVQGNKRPNYKKSCALVVIVLGIFLICFLPYHVVRTLFLQAEQECSVNSSPELCHRVTWLRRAAVVTLGLAAGNSCLDPLLYFFAGGNFWNFCRKEVAKLSKSKRNSAAANLPIAELRELSVKAEGMY
ncbi:cysteinyl leukotriene receptor 2 isoform X1 [Scleropages formosus]|uniref:Cysteinyl leukotriene receptor 2-like n=1 Tax=Scleropages formosus TaxID=113540 RepID=A0A8C9W5F4_SCLFO|nr:cysteinyl leukotriene receptor 2-like isoform X1 [Scleropages formosus]